MLYLSSNNEVKQKLSISKQHLQVFDTCRYFASLVSFNKYISTLVLLFCTRLFGHLFSMCYIFQYVGHLFSIFSMWYVEFFRALFSFRKWYCFFFSCIDQAFRYNSLLEFIVKYSHNYQKVILLNLKMFNYVVV